jgi:hypothetical protein
VTIRHLVEALARGFHEGESDLAILRRLDKVRLPPST